MKMKLSLLWLLSLSALVWAESPPIIEPVPPTEPKPAATKPAPSITKRADGLMQYGDIVFDPKSREVRVPCRINMTEGLLEFAVVQEKGKVHEALLITSCNASDIQVVMKLLRYVASEELYAIEKERGILSGEYPQVPEATKKAARVQLQVQWEAEGKTQKAPLSDWIMHEKTSKAMGSIPWIYGGSMIYEGSFLADQTGDIASIFVSRGSLFLYAGDDKFSDDVWIPFTKRMPALGTNVFLLIQPQPQNQSPAKP
ncbi:MAG: hypothetical protein EAZ81_12455 [Verrucomicrobia bacterium]|nr:MAG: hypothetical protein EAZ81_12455 [Verrucomicrobiota bacterium]